MAAQTDPIATIQERIRKQKYRIGLHAVRHMVEEGFDENSLLEALGSKLRLIEDYPKENRCLVLGYFHFRPEVRSPLHLVCDLSQPEWLVVVTAYIPQRPWWISPTQRGR